MSNSARILLRKSVTSFKENIPHFLLNFSPSSHGCSLCRLPLVGIAAGKTHSDNGPYNQDAFSLASL